MDKTLLKKRIAREWLILLGAIGVGLIVFISLNIVNNNLNYREYQKQLSQWNKDHPEPMKEYDKKLSEWKKEKKYEKETLESIWSPDRPALPVPPVPPQRTPSKSSDWLIVFFPYIITQFIRSIIWAIKQVL
jgi:hypothetical protein